MLSRHLKGLLELEGITSYRLSKDLNIDQAQLSRFFNGKGSISIRNLERILNYLGYAIIFERAERREEERVRNKTPTQLRPKKGNYRCVLRCSNCNETFTRGEFNERLINGSLQRIECPYCSKKGCMVPERLSKIREIDTEKKEKFRQDKMKRRKMELPFKNSRASWSEFDTSDSD